MLLVHGFNAPEAKAYASYAAFRNHLDRKLQHPLSEIVNVIWPGDPAVPMALKYQRSVPMAESVAQFFADFLEECVNVKGRPSELVIVAHSLGCLLVLEALARRAAMTGARRRKISIVLMAAAVPTAAVELNTGRLSPGLRGLAFSSVLYSEKDWLLQGPWLAGHPREAGQKWLPEAVGLHGGPQPRPWQHHRNMGLDHTAYWGDETVAGYVAQLFRNEPEARIIEAREFRERLARQRGRPRSRLHPLSRRITGR